MAPLDRGITEVVKHDVSHSAGSQNGVLVFHSGPMHLPALAPQQCREDSSTSSSTGVLIVHLGGCGDTGVGSGVGSAETRIRRPRRSISRVALRFLVLSRLLRLNWSWS